MQRGIRIGVTLTVAGAALATLAGTSAAAPAAAPAQSHVQQAASCKWTKLPGTLAELTFSGGAFDSTNNKVDLYGGLDKTDAAKDTVQVINFTDPMITKSAVAAAANPSGPKLQLWGSAGGFRPKGDTSAAMFLGGAKDKTSTGDGVNNSQAYTPKGNMWATDTGPFQDVTLAATAYDPDRDIFVLVGGVQKCNIFATSGPMTPTPAIACNNTVNQTYFAKFDAMGAVTWMTGPAGGPGKTMGGSLVYDSVNMRMIYFGGSNDGAKGGNKLFLLDLKDPDLTKATWSAPTIAGAAPNPRYLHSAAYSADTKSMYVYGGVSQNAFTPTESTLQDTWQLDMTGAAPKWVNLGDKVPAERVGSVMVYDSMHKVVVLLSGRGQYKAGAETIKKDYFYLNCSVVTPTATGPTTAPTTPVATNTPSSGGETPVWTPTPCAPQVCAGLDKMVPQAVIDNAVANAANIYAYCQLQNTGLPPSPYNSYRTSLSLHNVGLPYNAMSNSVEYKAGCH